MIKFLFSHIHRLPSASIQAPSRLPALARAVHSVALNEKPSARTHTPPPQARRTPKTPRSLLKRARLAGEETALRAKQQKDLEDRLTARFRAPQVLFENKKVVVINKPPGCALQADAGSEAYIRWSLIHSYLKDRYGKLHIVHRLDKSTSGPLILARSSATARTLGTQFKNSTIKKHYLALVQFLPLKQGPIQNATVQGDISFRIRNRSDRMVIAESSQTGLDCKRAETRWKLVTATSTHAIVSLTPSTGRKHQLRLLSSRFLSAPIVGDFKYDFRFLSDKSRICIEEFLKRESDTRIMLHSSSIEFKLYQREEPKQRTITVRAPFPEDFRILCDQLDLSTDDLRE